MVTKLIDARGSFCVTVDESKFTPEFYAEFNQSMFPLTSVEQAIEHLANLYARGVIDGDTDFIEGYGPVAEMGIKFRNAEGGRGDAWIDNIVDIEISDARS